MFNQCLNKLNSAWRKSNRWHRALIIFVIVELKLIPGGQYGFYCNDPALSHPFTGDTISWKWLMSVCILLPLVVLLTTERVYNTDKEKSKNIAIIWYKEYLFGFIINLTITSTLKLLVGSPRPHFFDTCRPEEAIKCQDSEFIPSYTCTKAYWLNQSDRSFPSGHTSLALHAGLFIAYYLHKRSSSNHNINVRIVQAVSILTAVVCSLSRMTDHRHHWWDVLAGACIAAGALLYTIHILCKNFECTTIEDKREISSPVNYENDHEDLTPVHKTYNQSTSTL